MLCSRIADDWPKKPKSLIHIRGTAPGNTRSFECPDINGVYLNSDDAFVLNTRASQFIWYGGHCSDLLRTRVAQHVATITRGDRSAAQVVEEGKETREFKDAISWNGATDSLGFVWLTGRVQTSIRATSAGLTICP